MSETPTKSQPLHNFSLPPQLKWAHSNHRLPRRSSQEPHNLFINAADLPPHPLPLPGEFSSARNPSMELEKIDDSGVEEMDDCKEDESMPWKLRPRKAASIPEGSLKSGENGNLWEDPAARQKNEYCGSGGYVVPKLKRFRGAMTLVSGQVFGHGKNHGSERQRKMSQEKSRFWISLSREEIEEDVYSFTGSRPARRPKTRTKSVQKQLDRVFPGLYLMGMSVDYYRLLLSKATRAELQAINS